MKTQARMGPALGLYRFWVYMLLAVMLLCSIGTSAIVSRTTDGVSKSATPLLTRKVPMLRHLAEFESSLLLHQLSMNKFFTHSVSYERLLVLENDTSRELRSELQALDSDPAYGTAMERVRDGVGSILALTPKFNKAMDAGKTMEAEAALQQLNELSKPVRFEIDQLQRKIESEVYAGSEQASEEINQVRSAVHAVNLITALGALFMIYHVWARLRSERRLAHLSMHDPLTGLPHRRSLERHLDASKHRDVTLLLAKVDRFERVAASMGHSNADRLLKELALRLAGLLSAGDGQVFRLDGSLIAILLDGDESGQARTLELLREDMLQAYVIERHEVFLSLSIGSVRIRDHAGDSETWLRMAAAAVQVAERRGGNQLVPYSQDLRLQSLEQIDLESDLRHALERNELEVHYQPQQDLSTGGLSGFEALLRWRRNGRAVSPAEFVPLAEESGLIVPIGAWVFDEACRQAATWNRRGRPAVVIAVNVAMQQFQHPAFVDSIRESLSRSGVNPRHIEVELTESTAMQEPVKVRRVLEQLRELGIRLAIDDFGTGYSSLAYLQRLPLDKLKIDQTFIRGMATEATRGDACIVRTVVDLAHNLGLTVLAEGVEKPEQRARLVEMGCDEIQGFLYGKPLPAAALGRWLEGAADVEGRPASQAVSSDETASIVLAPRTLIPV